MMSETKAGEKVRGYFIKIREFLQDNQKIIYQCVSNKKVLNKINKLHIEEGKEYAYFFTVDEKYTKNFFKIGRTNDIITRLSNYNVGRINEVDLK